MANIAAMGDAAQSVEQGISGAFTCIESCMKSTLEMKHLAENEANEDADENAKKEQFVSAAMAQLKELAGTNFNIIIVRDYGGDTKGFDEADPPMPLIHVEYSAGQTADYRIYLFTKGTYERPEGPRWEESDIQWWPHDGTQAYKPTGIIVDEVMKLTFSERPGMTRAQREAQQNALTLDKAVRDANTRITAQDAQDITNSDNPEETRKEIDSRNAAAKAGLTNGIADEDNADSDAEPDADPSEEPNEEAPADEDAKNGEDLAPSDDQQLNPSKDGQENGLTQPEDEEIPQPKNEEHDETFQNVENEPPSPTVEDARGENEPGPEESQEPGEQEKPEEEELEANSEGEEEVDEETSQ